MILAPRIGNAVADGIRTEPGDQFEIQMAEFGRPLTNRLGSRSPGFAYGSVGAL